MKVEYVASKLGVEFELHISAAEYRKATAASASGLEEHGALWLAVKAFAHEYKCVNQIKMRDIEEAYRHIKKDGTIILMVKQFERTTWYEVYALSEGCIIPVITSDDGENFVINYSQKTRDKATNEL